MASKGGAAAAAAGPRVVTGMIRLTVPAGKATPSPPIGPALGQKGLNLMEFCKSFNEKTKGIIDNTPVPVEITAYSDRTFEYFIKTPQTSYFLKKAAGIAKGADQAGRSFVGEISVKKIYEIAKIKQQDKQFISLEHWCSQIMASAKSMGLKVVR